MEEMLLEPVELTDFELDMVAGGANDTFNFGGVDAAVVVAGSQSNFQNGSNQVFNS